MSATRSSDDAEQSWKLIHEWQANAVEDATERQSPLVAQRYKLIIRLYRPVLRLLYFEKKYDDNGRRLRRALETLLLWGQQYEVSIGELDKLIDRSFRLRRSVLRALTSIGRTLTDRLTPRIQQPLPEQLQETSSLLRKAREEAIFLLTDSLESECVDEGSGDDDSDTSSLFEVDSLSEIAEDLTSSVEYLMDLDALYEAAKEDTHFHEEEQVANAAVTLASAPSSAAEVYAKLIQVRYPGASRELLNYLGRTSYSRFIRCSRQREDNKSCIRDGLQTIGDADTAIGRSTFHDSGVGTSLHTGSYAETVMSFHYDNGAVVRIPPLPTEGKKGLPFSCIACGKMVICHTNKVWKRHLFSDLKPYNCLETSCLHNVHPLPGREHWVEHLAAHHGHEAGWQSFQCNLCLEQTGDGEANVTIHLEKHLQDIALTALPYNGDDVVNGDDNSKLESDESSILLSAAADEVHDKAIALFDFKRENDSELSLVEGQLIWVLYSHGKGWLVAKDPTTLQIGLVPEQYVRLLATDHIGEGPNTPRDVDTTTQVAHTAQRRSTRFDIADFYSIITNSLDAVSHTGNIDDSHDPGYKSQSPQGASPVEGLAISKEKESSVSNAKKAALAPSISPGPPLDVHDEPSLFRDEDYRRYPSTAAKPYDKRYTSDWSIQEADRFVDLLFSHGSNWSAIAAELGTKTAVMVKNYYTPRKDSMGLEAILEEADARKAQEKQELAEVSSPPPSPRVIIRIRENP